MKLYLSGPALAEQIKATDARCLAGMEFHLIGGTWLHPDGCVVKNFETGAVYSAIPKDSISDAFLVDDLFDSLEQLSKESFKDFNNFTSLP